MREPNSLLAGRGLFRLLAPSTGNQFRLGENHGEWEGPNLAQGAGAVGQFGLPDVIHCAGALGTSALGDEAEFGSWRAGASVSPALEER